MFHYLLYPLYQTVLVLDLSSSNRILSEWNFIVRLSYNTVCSSGWNECHCVESIRKFYYLHLPSNLLILLNFSNKNINLINNLPFQSHTFEDTFVITMTEVLVVYMPVLQPFLIMLFLVLTFFCLIKLILTYKGVTVKELLHSRNKEITYPNVLPTVFTKNVE